MRDIPRNEVVKLLAFLRSETQRANSFAHHLERMPRSKTDARTYRGKAEKFTRIADILNEVTSQ